MEFKPTRFYTEEDFPKSHIQKGDIVLATATKYVAPTLYCEVNGRAAIMNVSDVYDYPDIGDAKTIDRQIKMARSLVGKRMVACVKNSDSNGLIVLERKSIVRATRMYLIEHTGEVIDCVVESFASFGVFVDIGNGVMNLIHTIDISKSRYNDLTAHFHCGELLKAKIMFYDCEKCVFQLSRKQAYDVITEETVPLGSVIAVEVGNYVDPQKSGVFVEYDPANVGIMDIPEWMNPSTFYSGRRMAVMVSSYKPSGFKARFSHLLE